VASAADWSGSARGQLSGGVDTNPGREFISDGGSATPDGFVQGIANLAGGVAGGPFALDGTYDVGGRKFITQPKEDTVVQSALLTGTAYLPRGFAVSIDGRARDRRGADRDYTDLVSDLALSFAPDSQLDFRLRGGYHRFLYWVENGFRESYYAGEGGLSARYRFNKHHAFNAFGELSYRTFNSPQYVKTDDGAMAMDGTVRHDTYFLAGASYSYKGPINLTLSYAYLDSSSDSYGESYRQHRIGLLFGVALPWELTFLINGQLRLSSYPDNFLLSPDILALQDDENLSSASVKLVRPIGEHVDIDLRYAFYYGTLPNNGFLYLRHVGSLGVSVRF
jgi:hypothetical protein